MKTTRHEVFDVKRLHGFALIATISIMVLLVMIALAMLSLSTIELRASQNGQAMAEARANARLALMIAIGELQKEMGPDRRISVTADQRMLAADDDSEGSKTSSKPGNQHWTGVFDAWPDTMTDRPANPVFRKWLISGKKSDVIQAELPDTAVSVSESVSLVGGNTAGSDATKHVWVPTVEMDGGKIAWWVGDQGVKAALVTPPAAAGSSLGVVRNNLLGTARNAVELASVGETEPFSDVSPNDVRIPRVTSWRQSEHLVSDPAITQHLFHDMAAFSTGLLTNVRSGGFRKDLSMKLETYSGPPDLSDPENILYTAKSTETKIDEVGINFMELWGYYHLYKELKSGGGLTYTTGGSLPTDAPFLQTKRTQQEINTDPWDNFKHPITINYQTIYSFEAAPHPEEGGNNVIWLNFDPVVTLWNPLDVAVDVPRHLLNGAPKWNYLYSFWMIPYDINVSINGGPEIKCSILKSSNWKNDGNFLKLNAGVEENLTLRPGEVVKISQEGGTGSSDSRGQSVGGWQGFNGKKGFNFGGGFRVPLVTDASSLTNATDVQRVVVSPTDTISYTVTPRTTTQAGNSSKFALTHVELNLGGRGATTHGFMSVDSRVGYARVQTGEKRAYKQYWGPNPLDLRGNEQPEVFPVLQGLSDTRDLPVAALINDKEPFMVHSYFAKTEEENLSGSRMLARFNPRAYSLNFYDLSKRERDMMPFESKIIPLTSWLGAPLDETVNGQGYFGYSLGSEFGSNYVNTHSVPRQPIISLGALQHSFANGFNMPNKIAPVFPGKNPDYTNVRYPLEPQISHAIGNSLAPSVIPPDKSIFNVPNYPHPLADHSYLANRELWDDYFFSSIAPQPTPAFSIAKDQETVAEDFFADGVPLPVTRYLPIDTGEDINDLMRRMFSAGIPTDDAVKEIASLLRVDGMFNVNSTSVEAWKAVLGGLRDQAIVTRTENGSESQKTIDGNPPADGNTPVIGVGAPRDIVTSDDAAPSPEQWYGRRTLSDDEIEELAKAVVKEVRKRGPFLSLADFVNRRVGTDKKLAKSGAIQSALDSDAVSINEKQNSARSVVSGNANRFEFSEAEEGAMNYGAPSYVKQADILTPIAPILSARSDSFIIRAYGEATDKKGNVLAKAWCEASVERDRNYVDPSDNPTLMPADLNPTNQRFGRKFAIISFRWLNLKEVNAIRYD